jgi:hypothetical protein
VGDALRTGGVQWFWRAYEIKTRELWNDRSLAGFRKLNEALAFNALFYGR